MKYRFVILIFLLLSLQTEAAENGPLGARAAAVAEISVLQKDLWAVDNNPAALAQLRSFGAGISYDSPFLINEFSTKSAAVAYPIESGTFGLLYKQFGYALYNESKIALSYGQQLGKKLSLGVQLNYLQTHFGEDKYSNKAAISGNIGLYAKINDEFTVAATIINPNRAKLSDYQDERYPTFIRLGSAYAFSTKVSFLAEVEKEISAEARAKFAVEYQAVEMIYFRAGYATAPSSASFGFGLHFKDFILDFSSSFHNVLGFSPQVSLSFGMPHKK